MSETTAALFTAPQVAAFCQVDPKTIHNWVREGRIPHFRLPGRKGQYRFKAAPLKAFLETQGYDVPAEVTAAATQSPASSQSDAVKP